MEINHGFTIQEQKLNWCLLKTDSNHKQNVWSWSYTFTFTFSHLADAFIQSDLQMRTLEAIKNYKL